MESVDTGNVRVNKNERKEYRETLKPVELKYAMSMTEECKEAKCVETL